MLAMLVVCAPTLKSVLISGGKAGRYPGRLVILPRSIHEVWITDFVAIAGVDNGL